MDVKRPVRPDKDSVTSKEWRLYKKQLRAWRDARLTKKLESTQSEDSTKTSTTQNITENRGRGYTLSIAIPGSILRNAQSKELRTYLAGQLGRAASVFNIDEIIVFDDDDIDQIEDKEPFTASEQLVRLLEYLECPQYLRKQFFPRQKLLEYAGLLNPLDAPHHLRANEFWFYREGVTLPLKPAEGKGSWVDVGLMDVKVQIEKHLQPGLRVTVRRNDISLEEYFQTKNSEDGDRSILKRKRITGDIVSPSTPRLESGFYWGYQVRKAESISAVFENCPYDDNSSQSKYDLVIGTSEHGVSHERITGFPRFKHAIIIFGGLQGLEKAIEHGNIQTPPEKLFQYYINTCPNQGSRTIRTEEAILISLSCLREKLVTAGCRK